MIKLLPILSEITIVPSVKTFKGAYLSDLLERDKVETLREYFDEDFMDESEIEAYYKEKEDWGMKILKR